MSLNTIICFLITFSLCSGLYKLFVVKMLIREFNANGCAGSFLDYGIERAGFRHFRVMRFLRARRFIDSEFYRKNATKFHVFQVVMSLMCYGLLYVLNMADTLGFLSVRW